MPNVPARKSIVFVAAVTVILLVALSFVMYSLITRNGEARSAEILAMRAEQDARAHSDRTALEFRVVPRLLSEAYGVPVGAIGCAQGASLDVPFEIAEGECLEDVLDRVVQSTLERREWRIHNGIAYFLPAEDEPLHFLQRVTLSLEDATTWDALKALVDTLNRNPVPEREASVNVITGGRGNAPAAPFEEEPAITINAEEEPAHNVLAEIAAQAPVAFRYRLIVTSDRERLSLYLRDFDNWDSAYDGDPMPRGNIEDAMKYELGYPLPPGFEDRFQGDRNE